MEASKLLHKDCADISKVCNPDFAKVGVEDKFNWKVWILGPPDYPYQGGLFIFSPSFPDHYLLNPPKIKFLTKVLYTFTFAC